MLAGRARHLISQGPLSLWNGWSDSLLLPAPEGLCTPACLHSPVSPVGTGARLLTHFISDKPVDLKADMKTDSGTQHGGQCAHYEDRGNKTFEKKSTWTWTGPGSLFSAMRSASLRSLTFQTS
uniref:Uncharacterized protein n=1 Tax=Knipowitschia caucasica TaxID=637954 RepID=A0AAV2LYX5_KNICA